MKAYIDKAALIAEIEKELNTTKKYLTEYVNGKKYALKKILSFLNTLEVKEMEEEAVSNDLEEAACEYDNSHIDDNNLAFKAGAQWQKEQMVKEVDLEGISKNYVLNNSPWDDCMLEMQNAFKDGFELGLKVQKGK